MNTFALYVDYPSNASIAWHIINRCGGTSILATPQPNRQYYIIEATDEQLHGILADFDWALLYMEIKGVPEAPIAV